MGGVNSELRPVAPSFIAVYSSHRSGVCQSFRQTLSFPSSGKGAIALRPARAVNGRPEGSTLWRRGLEMAAKSPTRQKRLNRRQSSRVMGCGSGKSSPGFTLGLADSRQPVQSAAWARLKPAHGGAECKKFALGWQKRDCNARIIVLICTNSMNIETKPTACQ